MGDRGHGVPHATGASAGSKVNPTEALAALRDQVSAVFARHGLEVWDMCFSPEDGVLAVQITGGLASDAAAGESDGFDEVIASTREAEATEQRERAIQDLSKRLHGNGGFLDT